MGYSELFATCSREDIRVWNSRTCAELLRVQIPNLDCFCVAFSRDGRAILSGWSDGKIRSGPGPWGTGGERRGGSRARVCV